jgi:hypothetical protein
MVHMLMNTLKSKFCGDGEEHKRGQMTDSRHTLCLLNRKNDTAWLSPHAWSWSIQTSTLGWQNAERNYLQGKKGPRRRKKRVRVPDVSVHKV